MSEHGTQTFSITAEERAQWQPLFQIAADITRLSPWSWCKRDFCFGIWPLEEKEPTFVLFFDGPDPESHIIRYLLGWRALFDFVTHSHSAVKPVRTWMLEIPMLEFSILPDPILFPFEAEFQTALGLWPEGRPARLPVFRAVRPGFHPWFPILGELPLFRKLLYQTYGMMLRLENAPPEYTNLPPGMVRILRERKDGSWDDMFFPTVPFDDEGMEIRLKGKSLAKLKTMPLIPMAIQIDLAFLPIFSHLVPPPGSDMTIPFKRFAETPPLVNYAFVAVNARNGELLGVEALHADKGIEKMWGKAPELLFALFERLKGCPEQIEVTGERMGNLLHSLEVYLPFKLVMRDRLEAVEKMMERFQRRVIEKSEEMEKGEVR
ncbi:MAG: hypothetical protein J6334_06700 [Kiritimatiellae bacterium]|nr:hypothetical protein [Kiritimatiellia bacterium]